MSIGDNIKKLRVNHGMDQIEFAKIAGVTDKSVSAWENGTRIPRMGAIQAIADYFGIRKSAIIEDSCDNEALTPIETELLSKFRKLTPNNQQRIIGRIDMMLEDSAEDLTQEAYETKSGNVGA